MSDVLSLGTFGIGGLGIAASWSSACCEADLIARLRLDALALRRSEDVGPRRGDEAAELVLGVMSAISLL